MNPFTLGSVWGVENGWASNTYAGYYGSRSPCRPGSTPPRCRYQAVPRPVPDRRRPQTVKVTVRERGREERREPGGRRPGPLADSRPGTRATGPDTRPTPATARSARPPRRRDHRRRPLVQRGPRALRARARRPALGRSHDQGFRASDGRRPGTHGRLPQAPAAQGRTPSVRRAGRPCRTSPSRTCVRCPPTASPSATGGRERPGKDYLAFSANVWNAAPRRWWWTASGSPARTLMDAYQYFYDATASRSATPRPAPWSGTPATGHEHWHFTDFASYRLLNADKTEAVRSGKEAFCLANTDAIDYTVKNANWHPYNTDLSTACGEETHLRSARCWTSAPVTRTPRTCPGQSFDITGPAERHVLHPGASPTRRSGSRRPTSTTTSPSARWSSAARTARGP